MKPLLLALLLVACGCPQKTDNGTPPPGTPSTSTTTPTPPATPPATNPTPPPTQDSGGGSTAEPAPNWPKAAPGIGENCGDKDACAKGLTCVAYYGIAGARGPQFKTCEIKCTADANCPADHKCITIADGPGQVCRK